MTKILVTGALGHIGSHFIREAARAIENAEISMIDNLSTQRFCSLFDLPKSGKYFFVQDDVQTMKEDLLDEQTSRADVVLHLAAITDATSSFENKDAVERNLLGTQRVAESCARTQTPFIFASTTSVYGTQENQVDESCSEKDLQPQSPYAEVKLKEERLLADLKKNQNLKYVAFRFGTICGVSPGMRFHTAINKFCWQAVMGQPITVWKTAIQQRRPYLALTDASRAVLHAIRTEMFDGEIYNVVTENLAVQNILDHIQAHIPKIEIKFVDTRIMNQLSYHVLSEKLKAKGFSSQGSISKSIQETIQLLSASNGGFLRGLR